MKITKLTVSGQNSWPDLHIDSLDCHLNVFFAPHQTGNNTIAQLAGHLLYGKLAHLDRQNLLPAATHSSDNKTLEKRSYSDDLSLNPGSIQVESETGQYTLKRQCLKNQSCRLTISATSEIKVDEQTIPLLLAHLPPSLLSRLYTVDFTQTPRFDWLLDELLVQFPRGNRFDEKPKIHGSQKSWSASDILTQLTDGQWVQIRARDGGHPTSSSQSSHTLLVVDREGQSRNPETLTDAEQDQLNLALILALVAAYAQRGIELPLLLDEPFLRQDQAAATAMVKLLHQFSHAGPQLLIFTENRHAMRQFQSLRSQIHPIDSLRHQQQQTEPSNHKQEPQPNPTEPPRKIKFYLEQDSPTEDAPSIGPKTADRLVQAGIRNVADLLSADPETTAEELDVSHINPQTIITWQQQACLVCRIPQLRGFGAQLLVACNLTEPEHLLGTNRTEILDKVLAFCETKQGQRILRGNNTPSRARIEGWIRNAAHMRSLEAA
jgi:hypothetical protein